MNDLTELASLRGDITGRPAEDLTRARETLRTAISAAGRDRAHGRLRVPHLWSASRPGQGLALTGGVAVVAATAVTAGVLTATGGSAGQPAAPPAGPGGTVLTAAYVLNKAATAAGHSHLPVPKPGQYIYVNSVETALTEVDGRRTTAYWLETDGRRIWISADGRKSGILRVVALGRNRLPWGVRPPALSGNRVSWDTLPPAPCSSKPQVGTYTYLTRLPTDPGKLRAWLYRYPNGAQQANDQAWTQIGDLLREMLVPPKLAAAMFRVAATIPGAVVVPHATDAVGRPGIAVARVETHSDSTAELIFDPHTYQLLGERSVLIKPVKGEGPAGTVTEASAQLRTTVTSKRPSPPPGQKVIRGVDVAQMEVSNGKGGWVTIRPSAGC